MNGMTKRSHIPIGALMFAATCGLALAQGFKLEPDSMRLYRDEAGSGKDVVVNPVTSEWPARVHKLDGKIRNKMKSLNWDLPRGVVVVFYENTNGTGRQYIVWGAGRRDTLKDADFEKKAAGWAWCYVDGWADAPSHLRQAYAVRPLMTRACEKRPADNTLQLHKDEAVRDKDEDVMMIESVTDRPEGELQLVEGPLNDRVSSLRWNLPPGVVVVLYDNADGTGRRIPVWGNGEHVKLKAMNDRISAWAWYDAAAEGASSP
jgi:hypothetical protein